MLLKLFMLLFADPKDKRDKQFKDTKAGKIRFADIPERVNYGPKLTAPPINQGRLGSCVGCSGVSGMQMAYNRAGAYQLNLSEQWLYFKAEEIDKHEPQGTYIRCAMKIMHKTGVPIEAIWPYKANFHNPGTPKENVGKLFKIKSYRRIKTLKQCLKAIASPNGFVCLSTRIYKGCQEDHLWDKQDGYIGNHAIHLIGYDQRKKKIAFNNSWGQNWGSYGQGSMTFEYFNKNMVDVWYAEI